MKNVIRLTLLLLMVASCAGSKNIEKQLHSGNYNQAIQNALKKLKTNKNSKRKQDYIILLEDAYIKAVEEDHNTISLLKKDGNPELYKRIFETYLDLDARQKSVKAVLPLQINGKTVSFNFNDYTSDIVDYKYKVSDYLIDKGLALIDTEVIDKNQAREAYQIFKYIDRINPNFEDTRNLIQEAHFKGIDYVLVSILNQTNQIIPKRLEEDLLNFDTYGLNNFWTIYHASSDEAIDYDFAMQLQLERIQISPERIKEQEFLRKKDVVDGWKYKLDRNGNVIKDEDGNDIKIDNIITVKARFREFIQTKSTRVLAKVVYSNLKTNQPMESFPIDSEFVFENYYGAVRGDKRALTPEDRDLLRNKSVRFPSNEQMVYDTGEDLKYKLKNIITSYNIRG